jgi:hypothetical protein
MYEAVRLRCMMRAGVRMCFGVYGIMPGNIDHISGVLDARGCSAVRRGARRVRMCFSTFGIMPGNIDHISGVLDVRGCSAARRGARKERAGVPALSGSDL